MSGPPDGSDDFGGSSSGRRRRLIQFRLHQNLGKIPGIASVRFEESGSGISNQVRGDVDTMVFADGLISAEEAYIQVNWWPQPNGEEDWFQIHYTETCGFDCGWHRHANNHVEGLNHYQARESPETEYQYRAVSFETANPVGILWEGVNGRLQKVLRQRYQKVSLPPGPIVKVCDRTTMLHSRRVSHKARMTEIGEISEFAQST